jgi:hypothetical protein
MEEFFMMPQPMRAFLVLLLASLVGQAARLQPYVEVLIPEGMPIKIDVQRDQSESQIVKYIINRIVPKDARQARITTVMVDKNGTIKFVSPMVGGQLNDPMSIATGDTSVERILLVVEWLETDRGKWIVDTRNQKLDIELLVKHGAKALPRSKFIDKDKDAKLWRKSPH